MRIKEKLPWTIDSPSIHLVQPSDRVPMIHEVVSRQPSVSEDDTILFTLSNQEWKVPKTLKKENGHCNVEEIDSKTKDCALKCGYISPTIHWQFQPRRSSSFDLRIGHYSSSDERSNGRNSEGKLIVHKTNSDTASMKSNGYYSASSVSTEASQDDDKRKSFANFNDILKELQKDVCSRTNSETESCGTKTPISERKYQTRSCETITRGNSFDSTESNEVFYDIELNTENNEEEESLKRPVRKAFSEETFEQSRKLDMQQKRNEILKNEARRLRTVSSDSCDDWCEEMWKTIHPRDTRRVSQMVDELLLEIYGAKTCMLARRRSCMGRLRHSSVKEEDSSEWLEGSGIDEDPTPSEEWRRKMLQKKDICELQELLKSLQTEIKRFGSRLVRHLKRRDCFTAKRELHCDWITAYLQANSEKRSEDTRTRFSVSPGVGDSGFTQWVSGMRMVARLPEGIPQQFRKTLWLNLAEKHLASRGVNWQEVEDFCFNEYTNPDDEELGVQIVKDVHRTGCSLFCGTSGQHNQALLKRVLLAYARWNKAVGYCQGFNMLAALILQVMDKSEVDSVKVMIFLIEGVLPESYFANNLRGLSVDMAVFRDLLRLKLPSLSRHLEQLQTDSKDSGTSYEPPLTNVFTMQWFLTLFCNCLPQETVLRVWDLIFLEGNQILLCTALAIWNTLSDRIMSVESADEFYSIMGVLTREMLEFGLMDANNLIKAIVSINFPELGEMRERYLYNITPWTQSVSTVARRGLRLFYSDDDTDNEEEDEKIAIATAYGLFRSPKKKESVVSGITSPPKTVSNFGSHPDRERIAMDISALKKQYCKLRERQRQAHIILTAACGSQTLVGPTTSPAMNHLLLGKCALVNNKGRRLGPPQGAIPPPSKPKAPPGESKPATKSGETLHWKDTAEAASKHSKQSSGSKSPECTSSPSSQNSSRRGSSSSSSTELCDDPQKLSDSEDQTNSLSECYIVAENIQDKVQKEAPTDSVDSNLQKELNTSGEQNVDEVTTLELLDKKLEVLERDEYDVYKETAAKTRRKSSFKIDFQEMKELDRKLSLKISEIERASFEKRRSIIEQGAIDSQVLFPFDRDYIKEEDLSRNQSSETEETDSNNKEEDLSRQPSSEIEENDLYVKKDVSSQQSSETEETVSNTTNKDCSESETIIGSKSLSLEDIIQISVNFIEQEKLFNVITSCNTSEAVCDTSQTLGENNVMLEAYEKPGSGELKASVSENYSTSFAFLKNTYKSECADETASNKNKNILNNLLFELESSTVETDQQAEMQTNSNSELNLHSILPHIEEKEYLKKDEDGDSVLSLLPNSKTEESLSPKKSECKYTFHNENLDLGVLKGRENFQEENSQWDNETLSTEDKSPFSRNSLSTKEYKIPKHATEDLPGVEEEKVKHQAARRGSEIALSLILEENLQLLSKFQQNKRSSVFQDEEKSDEGDGLLETYSFTKKNEHLNLSKNNEEELQNNFSSSAETYDQLSKTETKNRSDNLTDNQIHSFSELSWLSGENKLITKVNVKPTLDKLNDTDSDTKFESYKDSSFLQYKYKYDIKDKTEDILKAEDKVVEKLDIEKDQTKKKTNEIRLSEKEAADESELFLQNEGNIDSKFKYGYLSSKVQSEVQDVLKEKESKEFENFKPEREFTKSKNTEPSLDEKVTDKSILRKEEDKFDNSEFKFNSLTNTFNYNSVTSSKLFCKRQASLDYSPKSKFPEYSSERRTSLSLDSGTTLEEESRRTSTIDSSGETSSSKFSNFKFYTPMIPELESKDKHSNDMPLTQDVQTREERNLTYYNKGLDYLNSLERGKDKADLSDSFDSKLKAKTGDRLQNENSYSNFKTSETKNAYEVNAEHFNKSTFPFDSESQDKLYKPRYSSLSPGRRNVGDLDTESDYLSSPSIERFRSPSPSKLSTSNFSTEYSATDDKLKTSSFRLSSLKNEEELECDAKDNGSKFVYDNLDIKLRLNQADKSTSESKHESGESRKSSSDTYPGSSPTSPTRFNPFPSRNLSRQPKELGVKLGLYQPPISDKSPSKRFS